jgi:rhodanese-related sulfurtransferase
MLSLLMQVLSVNIALATDIITQQQLLQRFNTSPHPLILDVRKSDEFVAAHIPNAINIPHTELEHRLSEILAHKNNEIIIYCESGRRAAIAEKILKQSGFTNLLHLDGDMKAWRSNNLPTE